MKRLLCFVLASALIAVPRLSAAQARDGKLLITVVDTSGAVLPNADVVVTGIDDVTRPLTVVPLKANDRGLATFENLTVGRYSITAEFPGFEKGVLKDARVRSGENKHVIVLPLRRIEDSVTVERDRQAAAAERKPAGSALTREQIEQLSDDPDEMAQQLRDLAGPNATIRVDSFEGNQLPPKAQIKSIHITRDAYAAEGHFVGHTFVDIITQPGIGPIRTSANMNFRDGSMSGRNSFMQAKGPEQIRRYGGSIGGTLAKQRSSFSINVNGQDSYDTPNLYASVPGRGTVSDALNLRRPNENFGVHGFLDYALTKDQTLRVMVNGNKGESRNLGVGAYDLIERAYDTSNRNASVMIQEAGPLGRRFFINTRLSMNFRDAKTTSANEAPTYIVTDTFTAGGAQRAGGSNTKTFNLQSDLDYVRGIHSWRVGVQLEGGRYRSDDSTNYLGTYTFSSLEDFEAGRPAFYTKRLGDPLITYSNLQAGIYIQDDIRISRSFTVSAGLRYEAQMHVDDDNGLAPRAGITWAPFKSGRTSIRAGGGVFYDWLNMGTYAQTLRVDGFRQQEVSIADPSFPDPGEVGLIRATNRYLFGNDFRLPRNVAYSIGVDQTITSRIRGSISFNQQRTNGTARGRNLNLPIGGVRPDPSFANVVETVSDAESRNTGVAASISASLTPPGAAAAQRRFYWRRMSMSVFYDYNKLTNNSDGAFSFPVSGRLDTEWGPGTGSRRHFMGLSWNSTMLRNLSFGFNGSVNSPNYYNLTTGTDDNGDLLLNDRPAGVSRNSLRTPEWGRTWSARASYTFTFGKNPTPTGAPAGLPSAPIMVGGGREMIMIAGGGMPGAPGRYRLSFNVSVQNLTNRENLSGYSGVLTSSFFGRPTSGGTPRKIDFGMSFSF